MLRVPLVASLVELVTGSCCASPWSWSPLPPQAWPQLLGHDLDDRPGAAILGGPAPLLKPAHDHDPAALGQGLAGVLGLVAPDDHGEERRLLLPPTADGHPEHGPGDTSLGVADLGVVGEVAGEAHAGLGHGPVLLLPGRAVCPALGTGDGGHRDMPKGHQGQATEPTKSAMHEACRPWPAQEPSWLVGRLRLGVGHARNRPARSLHPGRGGRTRLPPRELLAARPRKRFRSGSG